MEFDYLSLASNVETELDCLMKLMLNESTNVIGVGIGSRKMIKILFCQCCELFRQYN